MITHEFEFWIGIVVGALGMFGVCLIVLAILSRKEATAVTVYLAIWSDMIGGYMIEAFSTPEKRAEFVAQFPHFDEALDKTLDSGLVTHK